MTAADIADVVFGTSTKIRVRLRYNEAGASAGLPPTMIVKGGFEAHSPAMQGMYLKEIRFYRDVGPFIDINIPRCHYAGSDPDSHQSIVVMDDLRAGNVEFCHAQKPQTYGQVERCLDSMARFHAQTWHSPEFAPGGRFAWIHGRFDGYAREHHRRYLQRETWQRQIAAPRGAALSTRFHDFDWMIGAMAELASFYEKSSGWCLCHGDTHLGNLYIEPDGEPGFFDMQAAHAPWHADVSKYIVCALDIADRPKWDRPLLAYYLERLAAYGVAAPDFDIAWDAHRREVTWGLVMFTINETRFQTEAVNTAYTARFNAAAVDYGTRELMSPGCAVPRIIEEH